MNLRKKLILQYVRQFFGVVVVLFICLTASLLILGVRMTNEEIAADLSLLSASDLGMQLSYEKESMRVDKKVEKSIEKHQGWLQIMNEQGKVVYAYRTPADIPSQYTPGEWVALMQPGRAAPYHFKHWVVTLENQNWIVLYGTPAPEYGLMRQLLASTSEGNVQETELLHQKFSRENAWYVIYDKNGRLMQQWNHPDAARQLELKEILQVGQEGSNAPVNVLGRHDEQSGQTYVVGLQNPAYQPGVADGSMDHLIEDTFRQLMLIIFVCIVAAGSWYALRIGKPLLHMVNWLDHLAKGQYTEPVTRAGTRVGVTRKGKWRRSFAVFKEMFDALAHLSRTLQLNEQRQKDMERTREEWITGLSHDLKTPLSSIFGYAAILESEQYEWARGEVGQFGRTIREKADYMNGLIEDLNLTYRLKNNALPMVKETIAAVETIRRITVEMVNDPCATEHQIAFRAHVPVITAEVDPTYFRRIIINVLANAIKHTPPGTQVLVDVSASGTTEGFVVKVVDNGPGMDAETQTSLFERYYRGGHTEEDVSGTGLGMAIAKQLVLAHDGNISVESELGRGTVVTMTFPGSPV